MEHRMNRAQPSVATRAQTGTLTALQVGSRDQQVLHQSGDHMRIDVSYFDLCVPFAAKTGPIQA
jgi:hypothetical protein